MIRSLDDARCWYEAVKKLVGIWNLRLPGTVLAAGSPISPPGQLSTAQPQPTDRRR